MNKKVTLNIVSLVVTAFTLYMMIYAARPWGENNIYNNDLDYLFMFGFYLWTISPLILFGIITRKFSKNRLSNFIALSGSLFILIAGCALLIQTILIESDAQSGLVFISLPMYQWLAFLLLGLICFSADKLLVIKAE